MKLKSILITLTALILIPLVSAFETPEILRNEWVQFTIIFAILFATLYSFLIRKFQDSPAPTTIVSAGLSILLTMAIAKRRILDAFIEENFVDWVVIFALIIAIILLLIWAWKKFKFWGMFVAAALVILGTRFFYEYIPDAVLYGPLEFFIEFIKDLPVWPIIIAVVIFSILGAIWKRRRGPRPGPGPGPNPPPRPPPKPSKFDKILRRGGEKSHEARVIRGRKVGKVNPGSFVNKKTVQRYARIYGNEAARRRFGNSS